MRYIVIKAKTRAEVADEYGISVNTLKSRLNKAGIEISSGLIYPKTLKIIYDTLGSPSILKSFHKNE